MIHRKSVFFSKLNRLIGPSGLEKARFLLFFIIVVSFYWFNEGRESFFSTPKWSLVLIFASMGVLLELLRKYFFSKRNKINSVFLSQYVKRLDWLSFCFIVLSISVFLPAKFTLMLVICLSLCVMWDWNKDRQAQTNLRTRGLRLESHSVPFLVPEFPVMNISKESGLLNPEKQIEYDHILPTPIWYASLSSFVFLSLYYERGLPVLALTAWVSTISIIYVINCYLRSKRGIQYGK